MLHSHCNYAEVKLNFSLFVQVSLILSGILPKPDRKKAGLPHTMSVIYDQTLRQRISIFIGITEFCRLDYVIVVSFVRQFLLEAYLVPLVD